ncbi:MAG: hypothetical protein AAFW83_08290 [Pseudomonadota bacterium]
MAKTFETDMYTDNIRRVINSLIAEGRDREAASFTVALEGLDYTDRPHVRIELADDDGKKGVHVMFARAPEMQRFYPAIRESLKRRELCYKDCTRAGQQYLSTEQSIAAADVIELLDELTGESFDAPLVVDFRRNSGSAMRALIAKRPALAMLSAFSFILIWITFQIYEILQLLSVRSLSIVNVDRVELILGGLIVGLMVNMRMTSRIRRTKPRPWWGGLLISMPFILAPLTA